MPLQTRVHPATQSQHKGFQYRKLARFSRWAHHHYLPPLKRPLAQYHHIRPAEHQAETPPTFTSEPEEPEDATEDYDTRPSH